MNADLYTDIHSVIEGLEKDMDNNPLQTEEDIKRYSYALEASLFLTWFVDHYGRGSRED